LLNSSAAFRVLLCAVSFVFTASGVFMKSCIFGYLCSESETDTTINGLIFMQQVFMTVTS
jgi:hypothetical protein